MVTTVAKWELRIPGCRSLKQKRSILRSLRDRLGGMNVSFVESGLQDYHGRAEVSVAFLAAHNAQADSMLEAVDRVVARARGAVVVRNSAERY